MLWLSKLAQEGAFGGWDNEPAAICDIGGGLVRNSGCRLVCGFGSAGIENIAAPALDHPAPFLTADFEPTDGSQPMAMGNAGISNVGVVRPDGLVRGTAGLDEPKSRPR